MPGMAKPTIFDDMPTMRPPLFPSHGGQEILCTQEMGIKVCSNGFSPRQEIELVNRAVGEITCIVDNNIHLTQFLAFSGYRSPIVFLGYIKLKGMSGSTNSVCGFA